MMPSRSAPASSRSWWLTPRGTVLGTHAYMSRWLLYDAVMASPEK